MTCPDIRDPNFGVASLHNACMFKDQCSALLHATEGCAGAARATGSSGASPGVYPLCNCNVNPRTLAGCKNTDQPCGSPAVKSRGRTFEEALAEARATAADAVDFRFLCEHVFVNMTEWANFYQEAHKPAACARPSSTCAKRKPKRPAMASEQLCEDTLDEVAGRFWRESRYSGRDGQDFDHRGFARECERMTREALGLTGTGGASLDLLRRLVEKLEQVEPWQRGLDHACAECVPHSDMLVQGFRCSYHEAKALLAAAGQAAMGVDGPAS